MSPVAFFKMSYALYPENASINKAVSNWKIAMTIKRPLPVPLFALFLPTKQKTSKSTESKSTAKTAKFKSVSIENVDGIPPLTSNLTTKYE